MTVVCALSEPIDLTSDITGDLIRRARAHFTDGRVDGMSYDRTHRNVPRATSGKLHVRSETVAAIL